MGDLSIWVRAIVLYGVAVLYGGPMSIKVFGVKEDGGRDLIGLAPSDEMLRRFSHALNAKMQSYPRGVVEDTRLPPASVPPLKHHPYDPSEPPPLWATALPIWTVYDHPSDWPDWYVARLFYNETPTGNMLLYRDIEPLRDELTQRGLVSMMRSPGDDSVIVETWL